MQEAGWYQVVLYEYDEEGNKIRERYGKKEVRLEEAIGAYEKYGYDCLGNRIYEERKIEEGVLQKIYYRYDRAGNVMERRGRQAREERKL